MFEQSTIVSGPASKRVWATFAGMLGESLLVGAAVLVPLVSPDVLPRLQAAVWIAAPVAPPPPPAVVRPPNSVPVVRRALQIRDGQLFAPVNIPAKVAVIEEPPEFAGSDVGVVGGVPNGVQNGVPNSILEGIMHQGAPPPPVHLAKPETAAPAPAPVIKRYRVGGLVKDAIPVFHPDPVYPPLARTARVSGEVRLEGVIGIDGRIHELKVLSGHPMLVKAAIEAVSKWIYRPSTLNGDPIEVIAPIVVTFRLN